MDFIELPIRADLSSYSFVVTLEQVNYTLSFKYNDRRGLWSMAIGDDSGLPIVSSINMQSGFDLIGNITSKNLPPGNFALIDETGEGNDPDLITFGEDVKLIYATSK